MATGVEANILNALLGGVQTLATAQSWSVAWPGISYTPTPGTAYLRVTHFPNQTRQAALGDAGENNHIGLFQVSVMWPENAGHVSPIEAADLVAAAFKREATFTSGGIIVRMSRPPRIATPIEDPPFVQVPVTMTYSAYAANPS